MPTIFHQLKINASKDRIFDCITAPKEFENWWPLHCSGEMVLDAEYNFHFGQDYDWYAKVSHLDQSKAIHYTMTRADEDWLATTFGFELTEIKDGIVVNFFHKDWPFDNDHFKISSSCWAMLLHALKQYVEKGTIVPFQNRE
jgi:uncharacterized protein YndB with AHSA1/START domain